MTEKLQKKAEEILLRRVEELKEAGIVITNPQKVLEDSKLMQEFFDNADYETVKDRQERYNVSVGELKKYTDLLGEDEITFVITDLVEDLPSELTVEEFVEKNKKRKNILKGLLKDFEKIENRVKQDYLAVAFNQALEEAKKDGAKAIIFKKPNWTGFAYESNKQKFDKAIEQIKVGTYEGEDLGSYMCGFALEMYLLVMKDNIKNDNFLKQGIVLLSRNNLLCYEFVK